MEKIRLSFQDRFLLAFEREDLPFNSHFYFESLEPFDLEKVKQTFFEQLNHEPLLHITCSYKTGECVLGKFSGDVLKKSFVELHSDEEEVLFLEKHFEFMEGPAVRMGSLKKKDKFCLIFSFYHPIFDGHAQMNYLKDYFDIYHGLPYTARSKNEIVYFRNYFKLAPISWYVAFILEFFRFNRKKQKETSISRLFDFETESRRVDCHLLEFDRKVIDGYLRKTKLSSTAFFSLCGVLAFDKIQRERLESKKPIVIYIPKSLRAELRAPRAFQNLIGFIWMKISRDKINQGEYAKFFREFYKFRSSPDEVRKVLFSVGLITKLSSYNKLKKVLYFKETKSHDCSILISSGRTPKEVQLPSIFDKAKFYGRGAMHRSPGISIMATSNNEKDFLCIQYLKEAFDIKTIDRFAELFEHEVNHHKYDP